ncbi:hypothetical protein DFH09DRAFT_1422325 [Mycena vulgaris]|nr:hypothetical protein DFH09DRAFT_1422325 [Mycena vulgaris]
MVLIRGLRGDESADLILYRPLGRNSPTLHRCTKERAAQDSETESKRIRRTTTVRRTVGYPVIEEHADLEGGEMKAVMEHSRIPRAFASGIRAFFAGDSGSMRSSPSRKEKRRRVRNRGSANSASRAEQKNSSVVDTAIVVKNAIVRRSERVWSRSDSEVASKVRCWSMGVCAKILCWNRVTVWAVIGEMRSPGTAAPLPPAQDIPKLGSNLRDPEAICRVLEPSGWGAWEERGGNSKRVMLMGNSAECASVVGKSPTSQTSSVLMEGRHDNILISVPHGSEMGMKGVRAEPVYSFTKFPAIRIEIDFNVLEIWASM